MKRKFETVLLAIITISTLAIGCESDDGNDGGIDRIQISDNTVADDLVDADDYWDNADLVWNEEFDNTALSIQNWSFSTDQGSTERGEWQNYNQDNIEVSDRNLKIIAKKTGVGQKRGDYTSARISSKYAFTYGRIEIRAKMPSAEKGGIWAKFALLGDNESVDYPRSGEINLMEYLSYNPGETYITIHSAANNEMKGTLISADTELPTIEEEFHTYGLLWTDRYLKFYIDDIDNITYTFRRPAEYSDENWPFSKPFYLSAGMAVGGKYGGFEGVDDSIFPATIEIDYIRVYHAK